MANKAYDLLADVGWSDQQMIDHGVMRER